MSTLRVFNLLGNRNLGGSNGTLKKIDRVMRNLIFYAPLLSSSLIVF